MSFELGSPFGGSQGNQSPGQPREARENANGFAEEVACEEPEPEAVAKKPKISASEEVLPEQPMPNTQTFIPHRKLKHGKKLTNRTKTQGISRWYND